MKINANLAQSFRQHSRISSVAIILSAIFSMSSVFANSADKTEIVTHQDFKEFKDKNEKDKSYRQASADVTYKAVAGPCPGPSHLDTKSEDECLAGKKRTTLKCTQVSYILDAHGKCTKTEKIETRSIDIDCQI